MMPNVPDDTKSAESHDPGLQSPVFQHHESSHIGDLAPFPAKELKEVGYTAEELKEAGYGVSDLTSAGFSFKQLKDAGFDASAFKSGGFTVKDLKEAGFTAEELKKAGFKFCDLKADGFCLEELRAAGFDASEFRKNRCSLADLKRVGFSAKELNLQNIEIQCFTAKELNLQNIEIQSDYHQQINDLIESRVLLGHIFGETWWTFLGFFAPYGTKNSFWNRLKKSPMMRHIFVHDSNFIRNMKTKSLLEEAPSPQITASDVDSAVNNCALICALLISIPAGLISDLGQSDFYVNLIASGQFLGYAQRNCSATDFSNECMVPFKDSFSILTTYTLASFYTNIFCLMMAVLYYMCRPSESYNISSSLTLLNAYTMEVRNIIRKERHSIGAESTKKPSEPFENPIVEFEVFSKARFYAQNESEEQKNQEFYMWYKSKRLLVFFFASSCVCQVCLLIS